MNSSDKIIQHLLAHVRERPGHVPLSGLDADFDPTATSRSEHAHGGSRKSRRWPIVRLFPVVIFAVSALLTLKLDAIWEHSQGSPLSVADVEAANAVPVPIRKPGTAEGATDRLARLTPAAGSEEKADPVDKANGQPEEKGTETAKAEDQNPTAYERKKNRRYTEAEVRILENLRERRDSLDRQAEELVLRENLLIATEQRIEEKIAELKELETKIQSLLRQHDEEAEEKLQSLVKMYQSMKPKQAAAIFEQLDMEILIDVAERMKEAKFALIMAKMNPGRAKELTVELAKKRSLPPTGG